MSRAVETVWLQHAYGLFDVALRVHEMEGLKPWAESDGMALSQEAIAELIAGRPWLPAWQLGYGFRAWWRAPGDPRWLVWQRKASGDRRVSCADCDAVIRAGSLGAHQNGRECYADRNAKRARALGLEYLREPSRNRTLELAGFSGKRIATKYHRGAMGKASSVTDQVWWPCGLARLADSRLLSLVQVKRWLAEAVAEPRWVEQWGTMSDEQFGAWLREVTSAP